MSTFDAYAKYLDPTPKVRRRTGPFGNETLKTVAEAHAFCEREGLDPTKVQLAHNYVIWESEETPEEIEKRIEGARLQQQRHLDAIREMYAEYSGRGFYGDQDGSR